MASSKCYIIFSDSVLKYHTSWTNIFKSSVGCLLPIILGAVEGIIQLIFQWRHLSTSMSNFSWLILNGSMWNTLWKMFK